MIDRVIEKDIICYDIGLRDSELRPAFLGPDCLAEVLPGQVRTSGVVSAPFASLFGAGGFFQDGLEFSVAQAVAFRPGGVGEGVCPGEVAPDGAVGAGKEGGGGQEETEGEGKNGGENDGAETAESVVWVATTMGTDADRGEERRGFAGHCGVVIGMGLFPHFGGHDWDKGLEG